MKNSIALLSALLLAPLASLAAAEPPKPNIVMILIDDMGYGDVEPFGCKQCKTPALNRMADEGMKLTSFYSAPICSASRAQIQTGCYAQRVSITGALMPGSKIGLNPQEHTVAKLLKQQGYQTMCVGKWHLGDQPEFFPMNYGFDHYFGLPYSNDMLRSKAGTSEKVVPLMRDNQVVELLKDEEENKLNRIYTEEAVKFIQEHQNGPFYLYLAHNAVHVPIHPGPEFAGHSGHGRYYDWVEESDWSVGRVMDTLRELHLEQNTLVFFTSDNGPWLKHGKDAGSAAPLRGGKFTTWEGGLRESTFAWWPGHIPAGRVCDAVTGEIDLLPTFVSLAGGTVPTDRPIDGANMSDLLLGKSEVSPREAHFYYVQHSFQAVRSGPWKLAIRQQEGVKEKGLRLYNLDKDIGETTNVASENPEVVNRLKALADKQEASLNAGIRAPGTVQNAKPLYPMENKKPGKKDKMQENNP